MSAEGASGLMRPRTAVMTLSMASATGPAGSTMAEMERMLPTAWGT